MTNAFCSDQFCSVDLTGVQDMRINYFVGLKWTKH